MAYPGNMGAYRWNRWHKATSRAIYWKGRSRSDYRKHTWNYYHWSDWVNSNFSDQDLEDFDYPLFF